jgi:glutamate--cysteine ligase
LPALWTGLLYDNETLDAASDIIKGWHLNEILNFKIESSKTGLDALIQNKSGWRITEEVLEIAVHGLKKRKEFNLSGEDETVFLEYLFNILNTKQVTASKVLNSFNNDWGKDFKKLYGELSF